MTATLERQEEINDKAAYINLIISTIAFHALHYTDLKE